MKIIEVMELEEMPYDMTFEVDGNREQCHATGRAVAFEDWPDEFWLEFVDRNGELHYGR